MNLEEKLNLILPPIDNIHLHITGEFGEPRSNGKTHQGIDFNYIGGQKGVNLTHPPIHSPVDGEVTFVKGNFGTVKIKDSEGVSHELLHTHTQAVKLGEVVEVGDLIGTMGGKGPLGYYQYPQHVHYQIKDPNGEVVNPHIFWKDVLTDSSEKNEVFVEQKSPESPVFLALENTLTIFESQQVTPVLMS